MKNIIEILKSLEIEIPEGKETEITKAVGENYKTIAEFEKKVSKIEGERDGLKSQLDETEKALKAFDGVDTDNLKAQIEEWKGKFDSAKADYEEKLKDRDFTDRVKDAIKGKKGLNAKAIMALLDMETLKNSHNWDGDISDALEALKGAEDSKMLFEAEKPTEPKAKFSTPMNSKGKGETTSLKDLTLDERMKLRATNPDLYQSMKEV